MSLSLSLGLSITNQQSGGGGGGEVFPAPGATEIDLRSTPNRFALSGVEYATEAEFNTAMKGSGADAIARIVGVKREYGQYVSPGTTEEVVNADFDVDGVSDPWVTGQASGGPTTFNVTGGECQIIGNGATNPRAVQALTSITKGKAYFAKATVARGTGSVTGIKAVIGSSGGGTIVSGSSLAPNSALIDYPLTFSSVGDNVQLFANAISSGSGVAGFNRLARFSIKECWPFEGYQQGSVSGRFRFTSDADLTTTKHMFSFDSGSQDGPVTTQVIRSYIALRTINPGTLQLLVVYETAVGTATTQINMGLGSITPNTYYEVDFAVTDSLAVAVVNGGAPVQSVINFIPGIAWMRLNGGQNGSTNNTVNSNCWMTLYDTLTWPPGVNPATFVNQGDSYGRINVQIAEATGLIPINKSAGGITIDQILVRVQQVPSLYGKPTTLWDGKPNGLISTADYLSKIETIGDLIGWTNLAIAGPCKTTIGSGENSTIDTLQAGILSLCTTNGAYYIDAQAILAAHGNGSGADNAAIAAGVCPPSLIEPDGVHINSTGNTWVAGTDVTAGTFAKALKDMGAY